MTESADPTTIRVLIQRIDEAYRSFTGAVEAVPAERQTAPGAVGEWSVRDVIAHIGADERWMAGQLEGLDEGRPPTVEACYGPYFTSTDGFDMTTQEGRNAWQRERLHGLSLDEVRALAREGHARLVAAIEGCSDADLARELAIAPLGAVGHVRDAGDGDTGWPLWQWLRGVTYHHYADHEASVRAAAR